MSNFIIYAHPYKNINGKTAYPYLEVNAANVYKHYIPYPYFAINTSCLPFLELKEDSSEPSANESLSRARRVVLFSDSTYLKPTNFNETQFRNLTERLYKAGSCEHESYWKSSLGTKFILNEPYQVHPDYMLKLAAQGLVAKVVPTDLSPYCGGWDPTQGARPRTTSYLICDYRDSAELENLFIHIRNRIYLPANSCRSLEAELIPSWNCVKGVRHD